MQLHDPRRYGNGARNALAALAQHNDAALGDAIAAAVAAGRDSDIGAAYAAVDSQAAYRRLWEAVSAAVEAVPGEAGVATLVFAMPWLLVCGTRTAATLPCVLSDTAALTRVLEEAGALGGNRTVGFTNALTDLATLERLPPGTLRAWNEGGGARDIAPAPVRLAPGDETVHLRFLLGAALAPSHLPSIVETASNVGAWGMKATAALAPQLAVPGVDVLAMPRAPLGVMKAAYAGRRTGLEAAFNLFLSNTLRRFRTKVGDASLVLSTHEGGELRATLHTPLDEGLTEGFRWPLHPLDDLADIVASIESFARECRVLDIVALPEVLPDTTASGALLFPVAAAGEPRH